MFISANKFIGKMFFVIVLNFLFNLYIICGDSLVFSSKYFLFVPSLLFKYSSQRFVILLILQKYSFVLLILSMISLFSIYCIFIADIYILSAIFYSMCAFMTIFFFTVLFGFILQIVCFVLLFSILFLL